jgi:hypothetical protein
MDLLAGYVNMLRLFLPRAQRDDIAREIAEEIRTQAADREAGLGRPLNVDEQAALLGQYGHPLLTAARYRPQQHLIGPIVFPYYWLALRVILGLVLVGHAIAVIALVSGGPSWPAIGEAMTSAVQSVFAVVAWLTIVGAVTDRWLAKSRALEHWDPRTIMPPAHIAGRAAAMATRSVERHGPPVWGHRRSGAREPRSAFGFVVGVLVSIWWLLALRVPVLMFGPAAEAVEWGPAMDRMFPVLFATQVVMLVEHFVRLTRPGNVSVFRVTSLLWIAGAVALWWVLLTTDHQWIVWRATVDASARHARLVELANHGFTIPFALAAIGGALEILRRIWRWFSGSGPSAAPAVCLLVLSSAIAPAVVVQHAGPAAAAMDAAVRPLPAAERRVCSVRLQADQPRKMSG